MSGFGWTPSAPEQQQPCARFLSFPGQPVLPPRGYQASPFAGASFYTPQGPYPIQDRMQAATHAPSHSQALSYSDSSDEDEKKRAVCTYYWKKSSIDEFVPANAVVAGRDLDGSLIYIGKAKHNGDKLPAKIIPQRRYAAVSYGGQEHSVQNYKILCEHTLKWIPNANGNVPEGAVVGGKTESGEKLYIGRASVNGTVTVGKVHRSHGCLYIPFGGEELSFKEYDVLVQA